MSQDREVGYAVYPPCVAMKGAELMPFKLRRKADCDYPTDEQIDECFRVLEAADDEGLTAFLLRQRDARERNGSAAYLLHPGQPSFE